MIMLESPIMPGAPPRSLLMSASPPGRPVTAQLPACPQQESVNGLLDW